MGIIHRDLKPANLFRILRADGTPSVKVLDFGISKVSDNSMTMTSSMMGSPYYMSPEQIRSPKQVDHRVDIFALGVILYELLTDERPFPGNATGEVLRKIIQDDPTSPCQLNPAVPLEFEDICAIALSKEVTQRYPSVKDFHDAVADFLQEYGDEALDSRSAEFSGAHDPRRQRGFRRWTDYFKRHYLAIFVGFALASLFYLPLLVYVSAALD